VTLLGTLLAQQSSVSNLNSREPHRAGRLRLTLFNDAIPATCLCNFEQ